MLKQTLLKSLFVSFLAIIVFSSCKKNELSEFQSSKSIVISGVVKLCNNTPVGAFTHIKAYDIADRVVATTFTNSESQFSITTSVRPVKIVITHISGEQKTIKNITSLNLGVITLNCVVNTNENNQYTINGDGFDNLNVSSSEDLLYADTLGINTDIYYVNMNNNYYPMNSVLNFSIANPTSIWGTRQHVTLGMYITIENGADAKYYVPVSGETIITNNTATEIQGIFSGVVKNRETNVLANISNGKFRARKIQ
ncbi:MAG: hypothetical protein MUC49_19730 [Raineya sp.]|jgi:hypothetical protein|nr:hypothetical protein [Raineya sp.]